ncbi:hypothetical protein BKA70DRAFT_1434012 [Coprinopsis sp. MPI-PUGE-AT-0042]|nr:hypothetical protein BKA70DRAFT_1434012 [Coprinopsis sp. MPI-PUGE-AT-0042]
MVFGDRLLARSRNAPLCIFLLPGESDFSSAANAARQPKPHIFDKLVQSADRWEELIANARCITLLQRIGIIPYLLPSVTLVDLGSFLDKGLPYKPNVELYPQPLELPNANTLCLTHVVGPTDPPSKNYDFLNAPNITWVNIAEHRGSTLLLPKLTAYQLDTLTLTLHDNRRFPPGAEYAPPLDFLSRSGCLLDELTLSNLPTLEVFEVLSLTSLQSVSELNIRMTTIWMEWVNDMIIHLASLSGNYQLRLLWLLIDFHTNPNELTQPFSLSQLVDLRNAGIWKCGPHNAAEIRIEVLGSMEAGIREKLVEFCGSTRRSPVLVSFSSDRAFGGAT